MPANSAPYFSGIMNPFIHLYADVGLPEGVQSAYTKRDGWDEWVQDSECINRTMGLPC